MSETGTDPRGLDLAAFARWYDAQRPGDVTGELRARLIAGGKSNLTYEVTDGSSWWIVRRPPMGHVQATAHDMGREFTVMSGLADTDVPVPRMFAHCTDPDVIGSPFYVMERVLGTPYRTKAQLEELGPELTAGIAHTMIDVLARLHAVDPDAVGLGGLGRPEGFLERQVRRWGRQLEGSRSRDLPDADELLRRLTAQIPEQSGSGIVHGDYRLDNLLVDATRTGEEVWLERARRFAMHAVCQVAAARRDYGGGRHSLWTGDVGTAIYLHNCLRATSDVPGIDVW